MDAITAIYEGLRQFPLSAHLEIVDYGDWGVEFKTESPLNLAEVRELAMCLSGNEVWPDLSWMQPIGTQFKLKVCR